MQQFKVQSIQVLICRKRVCMWWGGDLLVLIKYCSGRWKKADVSLEVVDLMDL